MALTQFRTSRSKESTNNLQKALSDLKVVILDFDLSGIKQREFERQKGKKTKYYKIDDHSRDNVMLSANQINTYRKQLAKKLKKHFV